jgi:hypothetical protein
MFCALVQQNKFPQLEMNNKITSGRAAAAEEQLEIEYDSIKSKKFTQCSSVCE